MSFLIDLRELKTGLIIFRRTDVQHRIGTVGSRLPNEDRYKTVSLKTPDLDAAT